MTCPTVIRVSTSQGPPGIGLPAGTADAGKFVRKLGATPYAYELVTPDAVGLPQPLGSTDSPTFAGLTLSGMAANRLLFTGAGGALAGVSLGSGLSIVGGALTATTSGYPSLTVPIGFSITGSGTASLAIGFAAGYSLPTIASQLSWDAKVDTTDPRLSDAREWIAATVEQAEAEAGASTTRRAWTAQRVRQAAAAWWAATASAAGQALATAADAATQRLLLGLSSTDSPTFAGLTVAGTATLDHIHGALAGEVYQHIRADGVPLAALVPYHVVNSHGDTDRALVIAARADTAAAMPAAGLVETALSSNGDGHGVVAGVMVGVNTAGLVSGDPVYVAPAGGLTLTRPTTGLVQVVAIVGRVHASTGTLVLAVGPALPAWVYIDTTDAGNLPISSTYTASGAISTSDRIALINSASAAAMTLGSGTTNGQVMVIKRYGAGSVTVTASLDGVSNSSIVADSATIKESVTLAWSASLSTWLIL